MPDEHSRLAPSSMYRIIHCPGSAGADDGEPGEAAELGNLIHAHGADPTLPEPELDEADRETFRTCLEAWREVLVECIEADLGEIVQETRYVSNLTPSFGGTADLAILGEDFIHVYDLKTGLGDVSAEDNLQLASYLVLLREKYGPRERYYGSIVQPMRGYRGTHEFFIGDLLRLQDRIAECADNDERNAGSHCRYCPLLETCPTAWQHGHTLLVAAGIVPPGAAPDEIAAAKTFVEFSETFSELVDSSKRKLIQFMEEGGEVAGYKLSNYGHRRGWTSNAAALDTLLKMGLTEDQLHQRKFLTPAQVEKLGVQLPQEIIFQPPSSVILAKKNSHKKAVKPNDGSEFDE